jgi:4-amino-4-deoxy-L-arabinose transferase-like glycosyltransferase
VVLAGWLAAAVSVTLGGTAIVARRPFDSEPHAWVSAHFSTMARAFVDQGIGALHAVPIQNNAPLGTQPDAYLHWPPLFPVLLSVVFRWCGESELVGRAFMLLITAAFCASLYALVRAVASTRAAIIAVFGFLVIPVTVVFGRTVLHLPLALLFQVLAVLAFLRAIEAERLRPGWAAAGLAAMALAVLSSWEPLLAGVCLLAVSVAFRNRSGQRLALAYLGVGALVAGAVLLLYARAYPFLLADLWHTVLFRLGMGFEVKAALPIHAYVDQAVYTKAIGSPSFMIATLIGRHLDLGAISLVAMAGVIASVIRGGFEGARRLAMLMAGLFGPWILWLVFMSHHAIFHDYEWMVAAPFAAASLGIGLAAAIESLERAPAGSLERSLSWLGFVAVPAVLLAGAIEQWRTDVVHPAPPSGMIEYAHEIEAATNQGAVVLVPEISMVPVYYARRHVIRGITGDDQLDRASASLRGAFPGSPVYLALRPQEEGQFFRALHRFPVVRRTSRLVLLSLGPR